MKKIKSAIPYILAGVIAVLVAIPVFSESITMDEAYSVLLVRRNPIEIVRGTAADVHPPLYYLILKLSALIGGESLLKYRVVTVLATWLNLFCLGAGMIRKRWGNRISVFYLFWFGLTYSTLDKSVLIRMYSWSAFFVMAAGLFAFAYYEKGKKKDYVMAILMTIAAMYTHYYAVMAVFTLWVILLGVVLVKRRKDVGKILLAGIIIAIGYLPWMGTLYQQSSKVADHYWITNFYWDEWRASPALLMESSLTGIGAALYFLALVMVVVAILRRNYAALSAFGVFVGTMSLAAFLSIFIAPIWTTRYLYVAWGMFSLGMAIVMGQEGGKHYRFIHCVMAGMLCIMAFFSVKNVMQNELMTSTAEEWVEFVEGNIEEGDYVIADDPYEQRLVYEFYMPNVNVIMVERLDIMGGKRDNLADICAEATANGNKVWYITDYTQEICTEEKMSRELADRGYALENVAFYTIQYKALDIFEVKEKE